MTLDIAKWMTSSIKMQQSISHNTTSFKVYKRKAIPSRITDKLMSEFGEIFLNDADYVVFFKKDDLDFTEKDKAKLFQLLDKALGKGSNMLNKTDFESFSDGDDEESGPFYQFVKITLKN